jgi:hypothetical protein
MEFEASTSSSGQGKRILWIKVHTFVVEVRGIVVVEKRPEVHILHFVKVDVNVWNGVGLNLRGKVEVWSKV